MKTETNREKRIRRHKRIRSQIKGTATRPRLSIFRSNRAVWVQLIDDEAGNTLAAAATGEEIARLAAEKKIDTAVFDRGGYRYHGIVKAIAEGARKGGLKF